MAAMLSQELHALLILTLWNQTALNQLTTFASDVLQGLLWTLMANVKKSVKIVELTMISTDCVLAATLDIL